MTVDFPGGQQVDAHLDGMTIVTNQDGSAPAPFALFLASIGTCAGIYVLSFCQSRGLPTEGISLVQNLVPDPETGGIKGFSLEIQVPESFPAKYHDALVRAASQCAVKRTIDARPEFSVTTVVR